MPILDITLVKACMLAKMVYLINIHERCGSIKCTSKIAGLHVHVYRVIKMGH